MELARRNLQKNTGKDSGAVLEAYYSEFRRLGIGAAVRACGEKGQSLVADNPPKGSNGTGHLGVTYYDADYYYQCDDMIKAITAGADELAKDWGQGAFQEPDYASQNLWSYQDFNTAWGNPFVATNEYMIDLTQKPPDGFSFLLCDDGADSSLTVSYKDSSDGGKTVSRQVKLPFSPTSSTVSAGTGVLTVYKPGQARPQTGSYLSQFTQYCNAAERLQFDNNSEDAMQVNQYLKNFNVYSYLGWRFKHYPVTDVHC